jgi:putative transposase
LNGGTGWSEIRNESDHDSIDDVAAKAAGQEQVEPDFDEQGVAEQLVAQAREKGVELVGPEGLLSRLEPELSDQFGYNKHDPLGRNRGESRNGVRSIHKPGQQE